MAPTTAAQDKIRKTVLWTTNDFTTSEVICTAKAWRHVLDGHPEMAGMESHVKASISDPDSVKLSTTNPAAFAFEYTTEMSVDIRTVVAYDDPAQFLAGQPTIGKLITAMPIDEVLYAAPSTGAAIYQRPNPANNSVDVQDASNKEKEETT